jgi:nucleoid-associated protein YgaU
MAGKRIDRRTIRNRAEMYEETFRKRGVKFIDQYPTPKMREITPEMAAQVEQVSHIWSVGDRFYKLAHKYYGDSSWWWVIARFNARPTESHVELGDMIIIPLPLSDALRIVRG